MKKCVFLLVIISLLFVGGCISSSPWDGVPYQQANEWRAIGVQAYPAKQFMREGFTAKDAQPWVQMDIKNPNTVVAWHRAGFTAREASMWMSKNFTLQQAIEYKSKGLSVSN